MDTTQDSMAEQLCALYAEKEAFERYFPGRSVADVVEAATGVRPDEPDHLSSSEDDSLEAQLIELYADKQTLAETFPGLDLHEIANVLAPALPKAA